MMDAQLSGVSVGEPVSPFYIASAGVVGSQRPHVLKHDECFAVLDSFGNVEANSTGVEWLFFEDTRYLSRLLLTVEGSRPLLLSSSVSADNVALVVDLTNPDLREKGRSWLARDTVHIRRTLMLTGDALHCSLVLRNYGIGLAAFLLTAEFDADFADIFELRGAVRKKRAKLLGQEQQQSEIAISYLGLDHTLRRTRFVFDPIPNCVAAGRVEWNIALAAGVEQTFRFV